MQNSAIGLKIYVMRSFFLCAILASGCATYKTPVSQKPIWEDTSAILRNIQGMPQNLSLQQIRDTIISNSTRPAYWLIHMLEMDKEEVHVKGNLLVDRMNGEVFRYELFNADGSIRLQAVFTNYATYKGCRIPQKIDVRWPAHGTTLSMAFSNIVVNGNLNPKIFMPAIPR